MTGRHANHGPLVLDSVETQWAVPIATPFGPAIGEEPLSIQKSLMVSIRYSIVTEDEWGWYSAGTRSVGP
jgi:hypothetical protein